MIMHNISYDSAISYKRQFVKVTIKLKHILNVWSLIKNVSDNGRLGARTVIKSFVETEKSPMETKSFEVYYSMGQITRSI